MVGRPQLASDGRGRLMYHPQLAFLLSHAIIIGFQQQGGREGGEVSERQSAHFAAMPEVTLMGKTTAWITQGCSYSIERT